MELDEIETDVLNLVLFPEEFDTIVSECRSTSNPNVVADVIKSLIHKKLIVPGIQDEAGKFKPGAMYNTDRMSDYLYVATVQGQQIMIN